MCVCSRRHVYEEAMKIYLPSSLPPFPHKDTSANWHPEIQGREGGPFHLLRCRSTTTQVLQKMGGIVFGNAAA